jgi:putative transposase
VPKDTQRTATADRAQLRLPEQVTVAVAELVGAAREGLLALAVGTGLQVLEVMLEEDVARLVSPKGRHNPDRTAVRHGRMSRPPWNFGGGPCDQAAASSFVDVTSVAIV